MTLASNTITPRQGPAAPHRAGAPAVMIVEPLPEEQWRLARMFTVQGYRVIGSASLHAASVLLGRFPVDLILLANESIDTESEHTVAELARTHPKVRLLVMGDGKLALRYRDSLPGIEWIPRPARMQDLLDLDTAVA